MTEGQATGVVMTEGQVCGLLPVSFENPGTTFAELIAMLFQAGQEREIASVRFQLIAKPADIRAARCLIVRTARAIGGGFVLRRLAVALREGG
jgi:hypothetical protein